MEQCDLKGPVCTCKSDMLLEAWGSCAHLCTLSSAGDEVQPSAFPTRMKTFRLGHHVWLVVGARCLRVSQMAGSSGHSCRNKA